MEGVFSWDDMVREEQDWPPDWWAVTGVPRAELLDGAGDGIVLGKNHIES